MQNWFGLTEKFQVLKICLRKIPKFASGNFFNVAILVRFCSRVLLDDSAVLNFAPEFSQTASPSEFCLRQVRYLAPPAPKSFNFTFSSLRLENLPPAWKFAPGEVLSISPQFCTPEVGVKKKWGYKNFSSNITARMVQLWQGHRDLVPIGWLWGWKTVREAIREWIWRSGCKEKKFPETFIL